MGVKLGQEPPEFYAELNPGIREVVRYLRQNGFVTTDSGDGITKLAAGWDPSEALNYPHVFIHGEVYGMIGHARVLLRRLEIGKDEGKIPPGFSVQLTYDPADDSVILSVAWPPPAPPEL